MLAVVGAIALTLALGWVALWAGSFALFCFLGFDEVNIPAGFMFLIPLVGSLVTWWYLVGTHIHLSLN